MPDDALQIVPTSPSVSNPPLLFLRNLKELIADQTEQIGRGESIQCAEHVIGEPIDRKETRQRHEKQQRREQRQEEEVGEFGRKSQAIVLERALRRAPDYTKPAERNMQSIKQTLVVVSIAIRMIMPPLPGFFLFTAAQRSELLILAVPFEQNCAARQGLLVIYTDGHLGAARRRSAPRRRSSRPTRRAQRSAGPKRSLLGRPLGICSVVNGDRRLQKCDRAVGPGPTTPNLRSAVRAGAIVGATQRS